MSLLEATTVHGIGPDELASTDVEITRPGTADGILGRPSTRGMSGRRVGGVSNMRPSTSDGERGEGANGGGGVKGTLTERLGGMRIGNPAALLQKFAASSAATYQIVDAEINVSFGQSPTHVKEHYMCI
jgi:hypothetical protein